MIKIEDCSDYLKSLLIESNLCETGMVFIEYDDDELIDIVKKDKDLLDKLTLETMKLGIEEYFDILDFDCEDAVITVYKGVLDEVIF